jgi:hypothetical protein
MDRDLKIANLVNLLLDITTCPFEGILTKTVLEEMKTLSLNYLDLEFREGNMNSN